MFQAEAAASIVVSLVYGDLKLDKVKEIAPFLQSRYSSAELAWGVRELTYDTDLDDKRRYKGELSPADFERVLRKRAVLLKSLKMRLTEQERDKLIRIWPRDLEIADFHMCGFDRFNQPLYRFGPRKPRVIPPAKDEEVEVKYTSVHDF